MENINDCWATPPNVYKTICDFWNVYPTVDVCAGSDNSKCDVWFDIQIDALAPLPWYKAATELLPARKYFWMNPPYSQPLMTRFIKKAVEQADFGAVTLFLLPAFVDQAWYHDLIKPFPHEFWRGRIKHIAPQGIKPSSPRYGSIHGIIAYNFLEG
jgi:phage N-6-adenine-methyltransferase